jgi:hypothetical protein
MSARLEVAFQHVSDAVQESSAFAGRRSRPVGPVEGSPRSGDSRLDLVVGRDVDLGHDR